MWERSSTSVSGSAVAAWPRANCGSGWQLERLTRNRWRCRRWPDWRPARRMITPKRPGITPSRILVAGLAALALLVLAACSSSFVREGGSRVSTPKYVATAVVKLGDTLYRPGTTHTEQTA